MIVYRGDSSNQWSIKPWLKSRYKFPALFFTTNIELAKLYSLHKTNLKSNSFIYEASIIGEVPSVDFLFMDTFTYSFKNLVTDSYKNRMKCLRICNCIDYPSERLKVSYRSDIIAVFDFSSIKNCHFIE